ncbi:hypothetical protein EUBDOL_00931 [Amedibacillus dolichus DSM 3991]|uniref:Uncharacterized protein n=1 Tax=Amedibacillus dolichus DSM 3991 TaxID=428127 RepID=A8RAW2_9FIRM|nr:hypothetical protein EUBDOL_00931 [Amedibacillus dolichus DSM 3991]
MLKCAGKDRKHSFLTACFDTILQKYTAINERNNISKM